MPSNPADTGPCRMHVSIEPINAEYGFVMFGTAGLDKTTAVVRRTAPLAAMVLQPIKIASTARLQQLLARVRRRPTCQASWRGSVYDLLSNSADIDNPVRGHCRTVMFYFTRPSHDRIMHYPAFGVCPPQDA